MLEYWNVEKKEKRYWFINFAFKMNLIIIPIFHFPKTQYSNIPSFHYSNWGGAPKFLSSPQANYHQACGDEKYA
jgi:hypothetical protein